MVTTQFSKIAKVFPNLNCKQKQAVKARGHDLVVTAGAGTGKTYTLVARYVSLLAEGIPPSQIVAITFTIKAALEMRSRVQEALLTMQKESVNDPEEYQKWFELSNQMDSARIGTIHSLCTEIISAHPVEAEIDPYFGMVDQSHIFVYQIQAVEDTLLQLVSEHHFIPLLQSIKLKTLRQILRQMLDTRLEASQAFTIPIDINQTLTDALKSAMSQPDLQNRMNELKEYSDKDLIFEGGDKVAEALINARELWEQANQALYDGKPYICSSLLYDIRRTWLQRGLGTKGSHPKLIFDDLKVCFDLYINPITGGKNKSDEKISEENEAKFRVLHSFLREAFEIAKQNYRKHLDASQALDFDDLEDKAHQLLQVPEIRAKWQKEVRAILVDEFQDTNLRQQSIVQNLAGEPGKLFIVGDPRQSIYRFRKADVTVFKKEQDRILSEQGELIELEHTYRAHAPLMDATNYLLEEIINSSANQDEPYYVKFTPMNAFMKEAHEGYHSPHIEFIIGVGEDSENARPQMARSLAMRLLELKASNQIRSWDDVAILCRASTTFPFYEEAFEAFGIPFVTVAGRGFYDRPEIRDLINIMRALSDPLDDLAFAGLLRSPAFGLSDSALYLLSQMNQPFWQALQGDLSILSEQDQMAALHALEKCKDIIRDVDRISVADLLKKIVDRLDYQSILIAGENLLTKSNTPSSRLSRNVDKFMAYLYANNHINVRAFLENLEALNDAGAREGEAPAEAVGSVVLMTIHQSKGLGYPVIVLGDAGRGYRKTGDDFYLFDQFGVAYKLEPKTLLYKLSNDLDRKQSECEDLRLLYVALTRAKSKLIISTHANESTKDGLSFGNWAKQLFDATGLTTSKIISADGNPFDFAMSSEHSLRVWCPLSEIPEGKSSIEGSISAPLPTKDETPLYLPIPYPAIELEETDIVERWTSQIEHRSRHGRIIGNMVHRALQQWLFPGDPQLEALLEMEAITEGLSPKNIRNQALALAMELLNRFRNHPIWEEINSAEQRFAEFPYTYIVNDYLENRIIDLIYKVEDSWKLIDFKTDYISSLEKRAELIDLYKKQVSRYASVMSVKFGEDLKAQICFLDSQGAIELIDVDYLK